MFRALKNEAIGLDDLFWQLAGAQIVFADGEVAACVAFEFAGVMPQRKGNFNELAGSFDGVHGVSSK